MVCMEDQELGFTTELGKNWEVWMAYRELYCNAKDEGGTVNRHDDACPMGVNPNWTAFAVMGQPIEEAHRMAETFIIPAARRPRLVVPGILEIYDGGSEHLFYRGIRAGAPPYNQPSKFTYNYLKQSKLTEDRTLDYPWEVLYAARDAVITGSDALLIEQAITAPDNELFESHFGWEQSSQTPSSVFMETFHRLKESKRGDIAAGAVAFIVKHTNKQLTPGGRPMTSTESGMISDAMVFCAKIGFPVDTYEVRVAESLGRGVEAMAIRGENKIVLSVGLLNQGVRVIAQTLIEEVIHLRTGYRDCTRIMQTYLFEQIVRLGESLTGDDLSPESVCTVEAPPTAELNQPGVDPDDDIPF